MVLKFCWTYAIRIKLCIVPSTSTAQSRIAHQTNARTSRLTFRRWNNPATVTSVTPLRSFHGAEYRKERTGSQHHLLLLMMRIRIAEGLRPWQFDLVAQVPLVFERWWTAVQTKSRLGEWLLGGKLKGLFKFGPSEHVVLGWGLLSFIGMAWGRGQMVVEATLSEHLSGVLVGEEVEKAERTERWAEFPVY